MEPPLLLAVPDELLCALEERLEPELVAPPVLLLGLAEVELRPDEPELLPLALAEVDEPTRGPLQAAKSAVSTTLVTRRIVMLLEG